VSEPSSAQVVLAAFAAVEQRDDAAFALACQPDAEFCWPPSLPYGGTVRGLAEGTGGGWEAYWNPFQPTAGHRRLDPRVVAATDEEVVVLWRQRGVTPAGGSIDTEVLGLYRVRDGKLARAQMFYFDPASVVSFLAKAIPAEPDLAAGAEDSSAGRQAMRNGSE
jgi:ketosteroid isomerase-like protein